MGSTTGLWRKVGEELIGNVDAWEPERLRVIGESRETGDVYVEDV